MSSIVIKFYPLTMLLLVTFNVSIIRLMPWFELVDNTLCKFNRLIYEDTIIILKRLKLIVSDKLLLGFR